jgi:CelD/BcsL family acetyltransferase involved in cellulose biosynthesis
MEEISRASWKFREKTAIVNSDEKSRFFKELTEMLAASGWLNIWILTIADKPAAFAYNVRYKNRIYAMEIGYSDAHAQLSPSEFLNTEAIKECFDTGVTEYDWLGDALPFKMKWTSLTREHSKYWIFNNTVYGKLLYGVEQMCVMPVINLAHAIKGKFCGAAIVPEDITV